MIALVMAGMGVTPTRSGQAGDWRRVTEENKERHPPLFFVSVASKGLRTAVSLLFAILAGISISVAVKGVSSGERLKVRTSECPNVELPMETGEGWQEWWLRITTHVTLDSLYCQVFH
jgi:hypothetical protein